MGQPPAASRPADRVRQWFAGLSFGQMSRLVVLVLLVATAAFGGLDTVDQRVTPFKPGEEFSDGEFTLTVERARFIDELKAGARTMAAAQPGRVYLAVVATLRNDGTVPGRLRNELDPQNLPDSEFFGVFRYRDGSSIQTLGAGLVEQLAFTWLLPQSAVQSVDSVTIRVWKKKFTQLMVTYGGKEWIDSVSDYGQTVVPVKEST